MCSRALCQILLSPLGQLAKEKGRRKLEKIGPEKNLRERLQVTGKTASLSRDEALHLTLTRTWNFPSILKVRCSFNVSKHVKPT